MSDDLMKDVERGIKAGMMCLLTPLAGESLPSHYAAKRHRELCAVRRDKLTISERAHHVRRLRKLAAKRGQKALRANQSAEADALEEETTRMILNSALKPTPEEILLAECRDLSKNWLREAGILK